ncbi:MAG: hypothetical protein Q9220_007263 [cf. Caloplaca sp. 1 TL-2023]
MRSPFSKTPKAGLNMPISVEDSDDAAALARSDKSNAWTVVQRDDIFTRRQYGEKWETICLDYPNRSKHAMQQQYSIMKKTAMPKTPTKTGGRRRNVSMPPAVNGLDGTREDESASESDRASINQSRAVIASRNGAVTSNDDTAHSDSDDSRKAKGRRSSQKKRTYTKTKRPPKTQEDSEPPTPRPKRARARAVNYNLLAQTNNDNDEDQAPEVESPETKPERKSKIVSLRTSFGKKLASPARPLISPRKGRKTASPPTPDNDDEAEKTPSEQEEPTARRMSTRGKKAADAKANDISPKSPQGKKKTPRKYRSRLLSHLPDAETERKVVNSIEKTKLSRKRRHSETLVNEVDDARPGKAANVSFAQEEEADEDEDEEPERKKRRASIKVKEDLGFLANGQPRKRRRRRTREEMMLDQKTPDPPTSRPPSKYQFPYLEGYQGPPPPDMETILARLEEQERDKPDDWLDDQDPDEISPLLTSLSDDDDGAHRNQEVSVLQPARDSESALPSANSTTNASHTAIPAKEPASTKYTEQVTFADPFQTPEGEELVFFASDLANARRNAQLLRQKHSTENQSLLAEVAAAKTLLEVELATSASLQQRCETLAKKQDTLKADHKYDLSLKQIEHDDDMAELRAKAQERERALETRLEEYEGVIRFMGNNVKSPPVKMVDRSTSTDDLPLPSPPPPPPTDTAAPVAPALTPIDPPTTTTTHSSSKSTPPFKLALSTLRSTLLHLSGHLRETNTAHAAHAAVIAKFQHALEEDEITMRGVRNVVKELVKGSEGLGGSLGRVVEENDRAKGRLWEVWDEGVGRGWL